MVNSYGDFVWYELMTTDVEAAKVFYAEVMDWGTWDASTPGSAYTFFTVERPVSGLMHLPEGARTMGAQPCWVGYVCVSDVDAAVDRIKRLGGAAYVPPKTIADFSRFSVFADPQTVTLGVLQPLHPDRGRPADKGAAGRVGWHELITTDWETAFPFYGELFGWQKADVDVTDSGTYQTFSAGGPAIGGMLTKPPTMPAPFWLYYFNVDDIDTAAKRVTRGGGKILDGPLELPGSSWVVQCMDPQGAVFALEGNRRRKPVGYFESAASRDPSDARSRRWSW